MHTGKVFISHSSLDRAFVEKVLLSSLQKVGVECWYSPFDIQSAEDWERSILEGLNSADWFLVVMTPQAKISEWVRDEVMWAIEHRAGRVVPILVEECDPRSIHMRLARIQHIDFRSSIAQATSDLLERIGVGKENIGAVNVQKSLLACRIVPYYVGSTSRLDFKGETGLPSMEVAGWRIFKVDEEFVVAILEEDVLFSDPIDFLIQRRQRHLEILNSESLLLSQLVGMQTQVDGLVGDCPKHLPYVMSIHFAGRCDFPLTETELRCLVDPSIVGISDDPNDQVDKERIDKAYRLFTNCSLSSGEVTQIVHGNDKYFISWANVMLVTDDNAKSEYGRLLASEVQLQHLWYKLHLYSNAIDGIVERFDSINIKRIKREIVMTKLQYAQYCRVDPTGATHLNELRTSLIQTSKLGDLYQEFLLRSQIMNELESIL